MRRRMIGLAGVLAVISVIAAIPAAAGGPSGSYKDGPYANEGRSSWSGFYIGAAIGYSFSSTDLTHDWTDVGPVDVRDTYSPDPAGLSGTLMVGFDRPLSGPLIWGMFADYTLGRMKENVTLATPGNVDLSLRLEDSWAVGGRLGLVHSGALWYLAAGYTGINVSLDNLNETLQGYFLGAGLEREIRPDFRMRLEYRYSDYGRGTLFSNAGCCNETLEVDTSVHSLRLGLTYVMGHKDVVHHESLK